MMASSEVIAKHIIISMESGNLGSKKVMTAAQLVCEVLCDHLNNKIYQCPFISNDKNKNIFMDLLNHIKIKVIPTNGKEVNEAINTLNIMIDTNQTSKLYSNHLNTYHSTKKQHVQSPQSTDCSCLFWKHNNNNIDNIDENELKYQEQDINKKQDEISTFTNSINCTFLKQIICNSPVFADKLHVKQLTSNKCKIQINEALTYQNIELKGSEFIFSDQVYKYGTNTEAVSTEPPVIASTADIATYPLQSVSASSEFVTFNEFKSSFHPNLINYKMSECKLRTLESCDSYCSNASGAGMVYCSDYDADEVEPYGCDYIGIGDSHLKVPHFQMLLKRNGLLGSPASSPVLPIKNKNLSDMSVKSAVQYDSNKYYIPYKGYGLHQSQSNVSMKSHLPCAGKMTVDFSDGSVVCFDD